MIKVIISLILTLLMTIGLLAQTDKTPTKDALEHLMAVKRGMETVNNITESLAKDIAIDKVDLFRAEMKTYKETMLTTAMTEFKTTYSTSDIDAIYTECTSDKIEYTDQTNDFFKKWRKLKGNFFRQAKQTYFKYKNNN